MQSQNSVCTNNLRHYNAQPGKQDEAITMTTQTHSQQYTAQLDEKISRLSQLLDQYGQTEMSVFASEETGYRMRAMTCITSCSTARRKKSIALTPSRRQAIP